MAAKIKKGDKRRSCSPAATRAAAAKSSRCAARRAGRWCAASTWSSATRSQSATQEGGIVSKEAPIHVSNIALADPKDRQADAGWLQILGSGDGRKKVRVAKRSGEEIDG